MPSENQNPPEEPALSGISSTTLLAMLEATAYDLWHAALASARTPIGMRLFERMSHPQIGDMVMETTTYLRRKENRMGFGKLVEKSGEGIVETKWTIETPEGKLCDWTNASIIAIPLGTFEWYPSLANHPS